MCQKIWNCHEKSKFVFSKNSELSKKLKNMEKLQNFQNYQNVKKNLKSLKIRNSSQIPNC